MKSALKTSLPREEWYFDDVPEPQQWACYYYEFARTHQTLPQTIVAQRSLDVDIQEYLRQERLRWLRERFMHDRFQASRLKFSYIPHLCPEFPEIPWQQIPPAARKQRLHEVTQLEKNFYWPLTARELRAAVFDQAEVDSPAPDLLENLLVLHNQPREFAVVPLEWEYSNAAHHEILDRYLQHRPPAKRPKKIRSQYRSPIDSLHALAALRLKEHYGTTAKVMAAIDNGAATLQYGDDAALRAAIRRAKAILADF